MKKPISVTQLNAYIARILRADAMLSRIRVKGEISNTTNHGSGHIFFVLKDASSAVRCFLPSSLAARLRTPLRDGEEITVDGYISLYEKNGSYSLNIREVTREGEGDLAHALEALKNKLAQKGYFDKEAKKPLPAFPRMVAVVTSPTGAVIEDILSIIRAKNSVVNVRLFPSPVQGDGAAAMLAAKLQEAASSLPTPDVIIVGRGGGSIEDLWAFNEEILADAMYAVSVPVISAVGHETDFTIADLVADRRAETPSAAAHMAVPDTKALSLTIDSKADELLRHVELKLERTARSIREPELLLKTLIDRLRMSGLRVAGANPTALQNALSLRVRSERMKMRTQAARARSSVRKKLDRLEFAAAMRETSLSGLNPLAVLARGYSIIESESGKAVTSANELKPGDSVRALFKDGRAQLQVLCGEERHRADGEKR